MMTWITDMSNLDVVAISAIQEKATVKPKCCNAPQVHIHGHKGGYNDKTRGGVWVWCSHCGAFSHMDGVRFSDGWSNNEAVDFKVLPLKCLLRRCYADRFRFFRTHENF